MKAKFIIAIISTLFLASSGYNFINNNVNKLQEKQSDNTSFNEEVKVDKIITENNLFNNKGNGYINNIKVNEDEVNLLNKDVSASENNINQYTIDINKPSIDNEKTSNNKENSLTDNSITEDNKSDIVVEDSNITEDNKSDIVVEDSNSTEDNKSDIDVEDSSNNNESTIDKEKVANVINLINAINTEITFDDEKVLEDVQNQYLLLNSEEKELVTNYSKLESAQTKMEDIKKQIFRVYNLINNIPEDITIDNLDEAERAVIEAEQAYNLLPEESKKGISSTTYSIMSMSKEQIKRLRDSIENAENEKVKAMEMEIENLPQLTNEDVSDYEKVKNADILIEKAISNFNSLPEELRNAVSNEEKLGQAYEKITYLKAKIIEKEIGQIDPDKVTEVDRERLEALDNAYKNLNRIGQLLVSNYQQLRTAIINLDTKQEVIDQEKVANVINLINAINTEITFDDEKVLEDVQNQYLLLNSEEKELVTNYSKLESAQTKMEDIKKQIFRVYNLINNIPEDITIDNLDEAESAVIEAEQAYNLLPEESKKGISSTTYSIMSMSKEQVKRLRDSIENAENEKVKAMEVEIENLPELSDTDISDYDKVKNADVLIKKVLNDFNSLPQELKNAVSNQEKLGKAYEKITYLKAKIIEKEISQIDLKKVTEADRGKLEALDNAYKNLNRIGQLLVSNYQHLRTAIVNLDINK